MKHLTIEAEDLPNMEGVIVPTAVLHCEPLVAELPPPMALPIPEDADAGHIASMALYLTLGADAEVVVSPDAMSLLEPALIEPARKRGVYVDDTEGINWITVTSDDGSRMVELRFPVETPVS